jgi:hypothetical protein
MRGKKVKEAVIEELKKTPIVESMCLKLGIGRTAFYEWKKRDPEFCTAVEDAIREGNSRISDIAEGSLISAIKDKNVAGIMFWLRNKHPDYTNKLKVTAEVKNYPLTPEQRAVVEKTLELLANRDKKINICD